MGPLYELAQLAERRRDWELARQRWTAVCQAFPDQWQGYAGCCHALTEMDRLDEAEALAREASERLPGEISPLYSLAYVYARRQDWGKLHQQWTAIRERTPDAVASYHGSIGALRHLNRLADQEAIIAEGLRRFGGEEWHLQYAQVALDLGHRSECAKRLTVALQAFPRSAALRQLKERLDSSPMDNPRPAAVTA